MRRAWLGGLVVALASALAFAAGREFRPATVATAPAGFNVVSSWHTANATTNGGIWVRTGAAADAPQWGAVLFSRADVIYTGQVCDADGKHCTKSRKIVHAEAPTLIDAAHQSGPLAIVDHSSSVGVPPSFLLRSSRGWLYSLQWESDLPTPTLYELGRKLDPRHLPALAKRGFAVAMTYWVHDREHHAVLLVGLRRPSGDFFQLGRIYGYLDGFALPKASSPSTQLERPLLGPDGALYRIDITRRGVTRVTPPSSRRKPFDPFQPLFSAGCTGDCRVHSKWGPAIASPNGKRRITVLYSLPCPSAITYVGGAGRKGNELQSGDRKSNSLPLGWIDNRNLAYIAYNQGDCGDHTVGELELANGPPWIASSYLAAGTNGYDATLWGVP